MVKANPDLILNMTGTVLTILFIYTIILKHFDLYFKLSCQSFYAITKAVKEKKRVAAKELCSACYNIQESLSELSCSATTAVIYISAKQMPNTSTLPW